MKHPCSPAKEETRFIKSRPIPVEIFQKLDRNLFMAFLRRLVIPTLPQRRKAMERIILGQICKDPITGYEGVAVARTEHLYGCVRVGLQARIDKDGKVPDPYWFDEPQLLGVEPSVAAVECPAGPRPDPIPRKNPK